MSDRDFQLEVLSALGELKAEQAAVTVEVKSIVARLDKLNGTVARHEERMNAMQIEVAERRNNCPLVEHAQAALASHINDCPLKKQMTDVQEFVTESKTEKKSDEHWLNWLWPFIWAAAGIFGYLVLKHAPELLHRVG